MELDLDVGAVVSRDEFAASQSRAEDRLRADSPTPPPNKKRKKQHKQGALSARKHHPHGPAATGGSTALGILQQSASASASAAAGSPPPAASPSAPGATRTHKPFRAPKYSKMEAERRNLPIFAAKDSIIESVRENDNVIVIGETGSGKTTQIPQYLLSSGLLGRGSVACTQPRRVAAVSVSTRVAQEYGCSLGSVVGYTIRFEDVSSEATKIKYVTDGMLLREIIIDPYLSKYNVVVLDEAHERTVNTDILFALLKQIQRRRKKILKARHEAAMKRKVEEQTAAAQLVASGASKSPKFAALPPSLHASKSPSLSGSKQGGPTPTVALGPSASSTPLSRKERKRKQREAEHTANADNPASTAATSATSATPCDPAQAPATSASSIATAAALLDTASTISGSSFSIDDPDAPINLDLVPNLSNLSELKLVLMSATLAAETFSTYFDDAPVMRIEGRTYPVDIMHTDQPQTDYIEATLTTILQLHLDPDNEGDILAFLTGSDEIESLRKSLEEKVDLLIRAGDIPNRSLIVCPLYANLPSELQLRVFDPVPDPKTHRKVILSTNIAETSLTIPGVRFVVDAGVVKLKVWDANGGMEMLRVVDISQAESIQRAGRAGRDAPGQAFRLYTESAFHNLSKNLIPEILRTNLASVVLQLKALHVRHILSFDFLTKPSRESLTRALEQLYLLKALNYKGGLSALGRLMVHLPLPPHYARMLLAATEPDMNCSIEVAKIVSMMSVESIFFLPGKSTSTASNNNNGNSNNNHHSKGNMSAYVQAKRQFSHSEGDHLTYLDVFNAFVSMQRSNGRDGQPSTMRQQQEWCRLHFLNYRNLTKVVQIYEQLCGMLRRLHLPLESVNEKETGNEFSNVTETDQIKRCILLGLFQNVARKQPHDASYVTLTSPRIVYLHPSSVLLGRGQSSRPELVVFTQLVSTSRQYMRECMELRDMQWLAEMVPEMYGNGGNIGDELSMLLKIKGGKQQALLHERLNSDGAIIHKKGSADSSNSTHSPASQPNSSPNPAAQSQSNKKQKQKQKDGSSTTPASSASSGHTKKPNDPRPPKPKKESMQKQKHTSSKAATLLELVNSL